MRAGAALLFATLASVATAQALSDEQRALGRTQQAAALAAQRSLALERQAAAAIDAAKRARADRAAVAARIQAAEADIAAAMARVRAVAARRRAVDLRLASRKEPIARLAAALQTMARRPPALALVQPGSLADLVHVRALLGETLPVVMARTTQLRTEVGAAESLRLSAVAAVAGLRQGQQRLRQERLALVQLEAAKRSASASFADAAMYEQDRMVALAEEARDIVDLMAQLDSQATVRARLVSLPGPLARPLLPARAGVPVPDRAPPPPKPLRGYRLPAIGRLVTGFGEVSAAGVRARGLTLRPLPEAQIVAPNAGRIAYAGPFRGYGDIVIVDHGGGWTSLLTGLASIGVKVGARVDRGSPLGRAAADRPRVTVELRRDGQPIDIVPLVTG